MGRPIRPQPARAWPSLAYLFASLIGVCLANHTATPGPCGPNDTYCGPNECKCELNEPGCICRCSPDAPGCRFPSPRVVLAAQIVLGAALVVAMAALVSVILRMCTRNSGRARARRETQRSATSVDAFVAQRLHDCPPHYDDISWEKPPSYANLPALEAEGTGMEPPPPHLPPPAYDAPAPVFTVAETAAQIRAEEESSN